MFHFHATGKLAMALLAIAACGLCAAAWADPPTVKFSKRCLMVDRNEGCAIADINQDGKLDIIAGTHWYPGPDFIPHPLRTIPSVQKEEYLATNGDHVWDVDGDGWPDVISIDFINPEMCWYKNPGKVGLERGWLWERHVLKVTDTRNEAIELRDFDGDGVPEIFVNCVGSQGPAGRLEIRQGGRRPADAGEEGHRRGRGRPRLRLRRRERRRPGRHPLRARLVRAAGGRHLGPSLEVPSRDGPTACLAARSSWPRSPTAAATT